jgi:HTH-type transcriptional regulator / antitoxin HigA
MGICSKKLENIRTMTKSNLRMWRMNIRPVKTDQDYDSALARIEDLWGAEPGTNEGDELEVLLTLVTAYENATHPVPPPSPIEAIRFIMDPKGLKQADLIKRS